MPPELSSKIHTETKPVNLDYLPDVVRIGYNSSIQGVFQNHLCSGTKRLWLPTSDVDGFCAPICGESFLYRDSDKKLAMVSQSNWII